MDPDVMNVSAGETNSEDEQENLNASQESLYDDLPRVPIWSPIQEQENLNNDWDRRYCGPVTHRGMWGWVCDKCGKPVDDLYMYDDINGVAKHRKHVNNENVADNPLNRRSEDFVEENPRVPSRESTIRSDTVSEPAGSADRLEMEMECSAPWTEPGKHRLRRVASEPGSQSLMMGDLLGKIRLKTDSSRSPPSSGQGREGGRGMLGQALAESEAESERERDAWWQIAKKRG